MQPGEYLLAEDEIVINNGRAVARVVVRHTGDRPVQVGSHYHFFEVNPALQFDRRLLTACASISLQVQPRASSRAMRGRSHSSPLPALVTCGVTAALWTVS